MPGQRYEVCRPTCTAAHTTRLGRTLFSECPSDNNLDPKDASCLPNWTCPCSGTQKSRTQNKGPMTDSVLRLHVTLTETSLGPGWQRGCFQESLSLKQGLSNSKEPSDDNFNVSGQKPGQSHSDLALGFMLLQEHSFLFLPGIPYSSPGPTSTCSLGTLLFRV